MFFLVCIFLLLKRGKVMGLTEWLIIGATGLMVRSAMKKTAEELKEMYNNRDFEQ